MKQDLQKKNFSLYLFYAINMIKTVEISIITAQIVGYTISLIFGRLDRWVSSDGRIVGTG